MSRQEQINNVSNQLSESFKCSKTFKMGFEAGAQWADNNPKSPWISVEDDLPCNNPNNIHFDFTNRVLATDGKDIFLAYMKKDKDDKWIWQTDDDNVAKILNVLVDPVTYWMLIPKIPSTLIPKLPK